MLLREGTLVAITKDMIFHGDAVQRLRQVIAEHEGQRFGIAEFKEWTGISRKYSVPLLEYFDRERVTRREGDARVVVSR
jgi:selenocysteine-specific elongation factor